MLPEGIYERIEDEELRQLLAQHPEILASFEKLDDEAQPQAFAQFIGQVLLNALPATKPQKRAEIINHLVEVLSATEGPEFTRKKLLLGGPTKILREIRKPSSTQNLPSPVTSLRVSSLLTGSPDDPSLERELRTEMMTADRVDILVSFIKWSGLRLLISAFEDLVQRGIQVRIITTSYMGASDPEAVEWLASQPGFSLKVSYDTERTRLHAKAYHFTRKTGYSTAYIGSANMSQPAMTSGLEWTVKVTAQDMPHILERFTAEFETYWSSEEFISFDHAQRLQFRNAIAHARQPGSIEGSRFFADMKPRAFQERILEALSAERESGSFRNLVISATGTGKTVIAAFDYARYRKENSQSSRLLFVVHRKEILLQARDCFRSVLRDYNFGELLVDGNTPQEWDYVFTSIQSLNSKTPWQHLEKDHFDFIILDEAHHGKASSYRPVLEKLEPKVLLGLTATPERMDGISILPDFNNRFAAEIRLPEALEEKLLCPFHYFGVTDPVSLAGEGFWKNGKYDPVALEDVYTGDDLRALDRLNAIFQAIDRYQPNYDNTRCVGFCVGVKHAEYMAARFREKGLSAEVILGTTPSEIRDQRVRAFRNGELQFIFVVDVFSEGIDIPEINLVLFLRPTESLTVFLQQLGRGLRHAPEKDCLTVLDFVGQGHRKYRIDRKLSALLRKKRRRIDEEVELDFPNLPPGCNIQLERVAREYVLENIRQSLRNLRTFVPEVIQTMTAQAHRKPTFKEFIDETDLSPLTLLKSKTWSEWKDLADGTNTIQLERASDIRRTLRKVALRTDPKVLSFLDELAQDKVAEHKGSYGRSREEENLLHYLLWSKSGSEMAFQDFKESCRAWLNESGAAEDLMEIVEWRRSKHAFPTREIDLGYPCPLRLHDAYGYREITSAFGKASFEKTGSTGVGVILVEELRTYLHFVTFRKEEKDFAPTTRYIDYPISRTLLHWESQANTAEISQTGQNYIHFKERGFQILFFARLEKREEGETAPFLFLGPAANLISHESERPIKMIWELQNPIPAELYELAKTV